MVVVVVVIVVAILFVIVIVVAIMTFHAVAIVGVDTVVSRGSFSGFYVGGFVVVDIEWSGESREWSGEHFSSDSLDMVIGREDFVRLVSLTRLGG